MDEFKPYYTLAKCYPNAMPGISDPQAVQTTPINELRLLERDSQV